jgi:predicted HTH domain antitoxin
LEIREGLEFSDIVEEAQGMTLALPANIEKNHPPEWAALHLAIGLYVSREATLGQAAEIANLCQEDFQRELCERDIPLNYSMEDLNTDLQAVRELTGR